MTSKLVYCWGHVIYDIKACPLEGSRAGEHMISKLNYWRGLELGTHGKQAKLNYWRGLELGTHDKEARLLAESSAGDT